MVDLCLCRMRLIMVEKMHQCPQDCNIRINTLQTLESKSLPVFWDRHQLDLPLDPVTLTRQKTRFSQMPFLALYAVACRVITWLREEEGLPRIETVPGTMMRTPILILPVQMTRLWICIQIALLMDLTDQMAVIYDSHGSIT